jgi:hypothetical protein
MIEPGITVSGMVIYDPTDVRDSNESQDIDIANHIPGRRSRGVVVSIYLDPENPQDSTGGVDGILYAAEWEEDALLW